jgi:exosortase K
MPSKVSLAISPWDAGIGGAVLVLAYALKRFYSIATPEDLRWILGPTAALVSSFTRAPFVAERGVGYVNDSLATIITPACAGVNFFIIASCLLVLGFIRTIPRLSGKLAWTVGSIVCAYAATLVVNAVRIRIGIALHLHGVPGHLLGAAQAHRLEGVIVYLSSLSLLFVFGRRVSTRARPTARVFAFSASDFVVPAFFYVTGAILVPLAHGGWAKSAFWQHATAVLIATLLVAALRLGVGHRPSRRALDVE